MGHAAHTSEVSFYCFLNIFPGWVRCHGQRARKNDSPPPIFHPPRSCCHQNRLCPEYLKGVGRYDTTVGWNIQEKEGWRKRKRAGGEEKKARKPDATGRCYSTLLDFVWKPSREAKHLRKPPCPSNKIPSYHHLSNLLNLKPLQPQQADFFCVPKGREKKRHLRLEGWLCL
ncbi:hypothetical protein CEXT_99401 [Caerostris extrusa]|uniref:Uncharacterized protein n=1 Tax=Caerostris extrusa TaxID=172846 RepID=A0AAV4XGX7_CAEEX|nr:hypothetical protein CEXT_99401 [Caerostris extrusa]